MSAEALSIVMAAGKGTRMQSDLPKVLAPALGRPMIDYVLDSLDAAGISQHVVVVGYQAEAVRDALSPRENVLFAEQTEQLGTGHAVMMCREFLADRTGPIVIVAGDSPMLQPTSIAKLLEHFRQTEPACLLGSGHREDPHGFGRIVRDSDGAFKNIVEEKDADAAQRAISEVNLSCYIFNPSDLLYALDRLSVDNSQSEYYLTDCPAILSAAGRPVEALAALSEIESLSVNTVEQLREVETAMRAAGMTPS